MKRHDFTAFITSIKSRNTFIDKNVQMSQKAFSLSEVLITLGLIGVLIVTMVSLNNFSDYKKRIATINMTKVENALYVWSKDVTSNFIETGFGPNITDGESLYESVKDNFKSDSINRYGNTVIMTVNDMNVEFSYNPCRSTPRFSCNEDSTIVQVYLWPDYDKLGQDIAISGRQYNLSSRNLTLWGYFN